MHATLAKACVSLKKQPEPSLKMRATRANIWGHLDELRVTLIRIALTLLLGFCACFFYHKQLLTLITAPIDQQLALLSPFEGFLTACKVAFIASLILTSPILLYSTLSFILPALHKKEKRHIIPLIFLSYLMITCGVLFAYHITLPFSLRFLQNFTIGINIWSLSKTVTFLLSLFFAHAFAFELVVIALFLTHINILKKHHLTRSRRMVYVISFIAAAILTPPDVVSQLLLAIPLIMLFELIVVYASTFRPY